MPIKKKSKKQDRKLVASKEAWEPKYIAKKYDCKVVLVSEAIATANKNGKPCRSRWRVEKRLLELIDALPERF